MTDLDYFAAHAPSEIPNWFNPNPDTAELPPGFDYKTLQNDEDREAFRAWLMADEDLPDHLSWVKVEFTRLAEARSLAIAERESNRYFAWRWHYAQKMLDARK